ncbi:TIGR00730 family Rossman fold protein [Planctomicrobium sp. SH664]|uniref:LOG family protein n=1 Tax=Planctomicrobium sp. SH664 TaxID=3448125 RepID=UPI003F5B4D3B
MESVCVFCGSRVGNNPLYAELARELGAALAQKKIRMVFGGGAIGLMGIVADAALEHDGEVIGVIPEALMAREIAHLGLKDLRVVESMHVRKALMAELSESFIALPGGLGTFEELCEILTWGQLKFHRKPVGLLNANGYFTPLIAMLDRAVSEGFMSQQNRDLLFVAESVPQLMDWLLRTPAFVPSDPTSLRELT